MIRIQHEITELIPGEYIKYDNDKNEWVDILDPSILPDHYIYRDGRYSAYELEIWGRGVFCKNKTVQKYYYSVETENSFFEITDYWDGCFRNTPEIFSYWGARRQGFEYSLSIITVIVGRELGNQAVTTFESWLQANTEIVSREPFSELESLRSMFESFEKLSDYLVESDDIKKLEREFFDFRKIDGINWQIEYPEFEGSGDTAYLLAENIIKIIELLSASTGLIMMLNSILVRQERQAYLRQIREAIIRRFNVQGYLQDPDGPLEYDNEGRLVDHFIESNAGHTISHYYVLKHDNDSIEISKRPHSYH